MRRHLLVTHTLVLCGPSGYPEQVCANPSQNPVTIKPLRPLPVPRKCLRGRKPSLPTLQALRSWPRTQGLFSTPAQEPGPWPVPTQSQGSCPKQMSTQNHSHGLSATLRPWLTAGPPCPASSTRDCPVCVPQDGDCARCRHTSPTRPLPHPQPHLPPAYTGPPFCRV